MKRLLCIGLILLLLAASCLSGCTSAETRSAADAFSALCSAFNTEESAALAQRLCATSANQFGSSLAGTDADAAAASLIASAMTEAGLSGVTSETFETSVFSCAKASLSYSLSDGRSDTVELVTYPSENSTSAQMEMISLGAGRADDYDADVSYSGKIGLVIIDSSDALNFRFCVEQARSRGLGLLLIAQYAGDPATIPEDLSTLSERERAAFETIPTETYSTQSVMSLMGLSLADALQLRTICNESAKQKNAFFVTMSASFQFYPKDSPLAANVVGYIPGRDADSRIILSADYDHLFYGYNENITAVSLLIELAKAIVKSGYTPQKTLVFIAYSGSEYAQRATAYPDEQGVYYQLDKVHPEWKTGSVHIGLTMPGVNHGTEYPFCVSLGLQQWMSEWTSQLSLADNPYSGYTVSLLDSADSSDFIFDSAGIPTITLDREASDYASLYGATQLDTQQDFDGRYYAFCARLYGNLVLSLDRTAVTPLCFTDYYLTSDLTKYESDLAAFSVDTVDLGTARYEAAMSTQTLYYYCRAFNTAYQTALESGDTRKAASLYADASQLRSGVFAMFRRIRNTAFALDEQGRVRDAYLGALEDAVKVDLALDNLSQRKSTSCRKKLIEVGQLRFALSYDEAAYCGVIAALNNGTRSTLNWAYGLLSEVPDLRAILVTLYEKEDLNFDDADFTPESVAMQQLLELRLSEVSGRLQAMTNTALLVCSETDRLAAVYEGYEF